MDKNIDVLKRDEFVDRVVDIIDGLADNKKYCSFAIDGKWGVGKSFVVKMLNKKLKNDKYTILNYNCWESSYYKDPLLAILYSILDELYKTDYITKGMEEYKKAIISIGTMFNGVINHFTGIDYNNLNTKDNTNQTIADEIKKVRKIILENSASKPVVIIVDEVDRCLPEYAIKVLERMYLVFNELPNVFVLTVMDKSKIKHSIEQIFGKLDQEDDEHYLQKFINFYIPLTNGIIDKNIMNKFNYYFCKFNITTEEEIEVFNIINSLFNMVNIRSQEKIIYISNIIHGLINANCNSVALMCSEILTTIAYYIEGELHSDFVSPKKRFMNTGINIYYLLESLGKDYKNDKLVLKDSLREKILAICDNAKGSNDINSYSIYYNYIDIYDKISDELIAIRKFYRMLQYIK